jgi:hypothetical protein
MSRTGWRRSKPVEDAFAVVVAEVLEITEELVQVIEGNTCSCDSCEKPRPLVRRYRDLVPRAEEVNPIHTIAVEQLPEIPVPVLPG